MSVKAAAYIRVSTREQDENVQRHAIKEFISSRNIEIVNWFVDKGESGAKPFRNRPAAQKLLEFVEKKKIDAIVVFTIDRIGRGMIDTMQTILEFENRGIKVISIKEEWMQTLDPNIRKLILSILSWVAEFERRRIRERQLEAWAMGKQKGRPKKVSDETILKYLKRYNGLSIRAIWKIMCKDLKKKCISYDHLRRRIKQLGYIRKLTR